MGARASVALRTDVMAVASWNRVKRIFGEALPLSPEGRKELVHRECADDPELREEVFRLLTLRDEAGGFLEPLTVSSVLESRGRTPRDVGPSFQGVTLAGRYLLGTRLGHGGGGTVYRARDLLRGNDVAVKVLHGIDKGALSSVRREVAMLRLLRLPGVVQLLDDGVEDGCGYLVMELVEGRPFPGAEGRRTWEQLEESALGLLEALSRIHWAGVLHCDLKPANVLVDGEGVPTVLDLGVSAWQEADPRAREGGELFGTLRYLAPERIQGGPPTVRADLFSVGVMLYEALAGDYPFAHQREHASTLPTSFQPAEPLHRHAPEIPRRIAGVVGRLVDAVPDRRPESAAEVHGILLGLGHRRRLPRFTGHAARAAALARAREGRSVDISGPRGSGRTRLLEDIAEELHREGRVCFRVSPSRSPLGSLPPEILEDAADPSARLDEVCAAVRERIRALLRDGAVVLADDADGLDRWTASIFRECRGEGAILRALSQACDTSLQLMPASVDELRGFFHGPDRIHHLREDAAEELWRRTFGRPAAIAVELDAWVRAGLARWERGRIQIARKDLERLRAGLRTLPGQPFMDDLPNDLADLLACIDLAGDGATIDVVGHAAGRPRWLLEAQLQELAERDAIRIEGETIALCRPTHAGHVWDAERRRRVHAALASSLPEASEQRLYHLLASGRAAEFAGEVPAVAGRLVRSGCADRALSLLADGIAAMRRSDYRERQSELLRLLLPAALAVGTTNALDQVLYEFARAGYATEEIRTLEGAARAALLTVQGDPARALRTLERLLFVGDADTDRWLWAIRVVAASYCGSDRHERTVDEATRWARAFEDRDIQASACEWQGWLRYRQHRFEEAAEFHARAAAHSETTAKRVSGLLHAAWAALEAGAFDDVEHLALSARDLACESRHAHFEARAELMLRSTAYRRGADISPDIELVEATRDLGLMHIHGLVALNEAAVAWRRGDSASASELANRAARALRRGGVADAALLAETLAISAGRQDRPDRADRPDVETLAASAAATSLPGPAIQALALLDRTYGLAMSWRRRAFDRARELPAKYHAVCREVLSVDEALGWLRATSGIGD